MGLVLVLTAALLRAPCKGDLPELVHPFLAGKEIIEPFDHEEAFSELEFVDRRLEVWPVNLVKLFFGPFMSSVEVGHLHLSAYQVADHRGEFTSDGSTFY